MCCIPGEGDEEDSEDDSVTDGERAKKKDKLDLSVPGAFASMGGRPKYVDGKAGFAFDPTRFNA